MNIRKTKKMESGINLEVLKTSGKHPCGVCQTGVGRRMQSSVVAARNAVTLRDPCDLTVSSGAHDVLGMPGILMGDNF